jgi:NADPH:quinone reductase-like Zn-dependent oxidoreductase
MRAVRLESFGGPSVLEVTETRSPAADERTALVRIMAGSINPSDVKNVAGAMKQTTLPRIPGRDYAGLVEAGPAEWIGAEVWATGGDVGFTRDVAHAEMIAVPVLRRMPETSASIKRHRPVPWRCGSCWPCATTRRPCPLASFASFVATRRKRRQQFWTSGTAIIAYV